MNMGHENENLSAYLDGALPEAQRARLEAHLQDCAACRAELEELRQVCGMVKALPQKPLPPGFLQRLQDRRRHEAAPEESRALFSPRNLAWAVCAVTVMFVTYRSVRLKVPAGIEKEVQGLVSGAASDIQAPSALDQMKPAAAPGTAAFLGEMKSAQGPVSTSDLVALAKQEAREEGLAAALGGGSGGSAAGLSAPAAVRGFGGRAMGEPAAAPPAFSNEAQQKHIEKEKARIGIRRIIPPSPVQQALRSALQGDAPAGADEYRLSAKPAPAPVTGKTAALLAAPGGAGRSAAQGALVAPADFSGGAAAPARPRKRSLGRPLERTEETEGQAVYSMEELVLLWHDRLPPGPMPRLDFSKEMLVIVFGPASIESVDPAPGRILVRYRLPPSPPAPEQRWRVVERSELPVSFEKLP